MRKRANSKNATRLKFKTNPNSVFIQLIEMPKSAHLVMQREGIRPKDQAPDYPVLKPDHPPPQQEEQGFIQEYPDEDRKLNHGTHNPRKWLISMVEEEIYKCKKYNEHVNVERLAKFLDTTEDIIAEILDEVTTR